ncbi:hypothetical protein DFH09DRAFT_1334813 [Mycena vulgaris]|nr:hypothetical protein DFH09DRAFT_1334813 [Mycena vulgaris]
MNLKAVDDACITLEAHLAQHPKDRQQVEDVEHEQSVILHALSQACDLARDTHPEDPEFHDIVERVNRTLNRGLILANGRRSSFKPAAVLSFAHSTEHPVLGEPQTRCAIFSDPSPLPSAIAISQSCLMLPCLTGWKSRIPALHYYLLDDTENEDFPLATRKAAATLDETYDDPASAFGIDEVNKRIFVADLRCVKSFTWADAQSGEVFEVELPMHTLSTPDHSGPLSVFAPGRILRAGTGSVAFWNLNEVESPPTTVIPLADPKLSPSACQIHPNLSGNMLCAPTVGHCYRDYACVSLDLDSAKTAARYLGHAGAITAFSMSEADPSVFLTAATDSTN